MKVIKFSDFDDIEYRKGSKEFGGIVTKLMEFLRLYKDDSVSSLKFSVSNFEKESNIPIDEINKLINSEDAKGLYFFDIHIIGDDIIFENLNKKEKDRPFESKDA